MSDKKKKEILKEPQEEFIDEGIAEKKEPGSSDAGKPLYENMKLEELHRQARLEGLKNYIELDRDELINKLKAQKS
ncbi:hypothetical protein DYD21_10945 [Rhodohalobacter sp. SW132]|uniref:hypothetical protein n=1 Tax=Rhodohalobacter sp. SW132 TaxID=2293433 RepID=UPI000E241D60|nr:hypothetical protein [Rhodohalobacter sp. SW132]REL33291.1 hypothetical protein DYD21_10945 [Rhodohalobacter sp. SW132]